MGIFNKKKNEQEKETESVTNQAGSQEVANEEESGQTANNVFEPKDIDPDIDVADMPEGSVILVKGSNYLLNKDKMLVKQ